MKQSNYYLQDELINFTTIENEANESSIFEHNTLNESLNNLKFELNQERTCEEDSLKSIWNSDEHLSEISFAQNSRSKDYISDLSFLS